MLNAHEIYLLGKVAVDENQDDYYRSIGTDIVSKTPEQFIRCIDSMIARLERIKNFASDYCKALEKERENESDIWM